MHNVHRDYDECIRRLHGLGVMVNASIVFGMDGEDPSIFDRTLEWTITRGLESATFHVLTPYPGTPLYQRMKRQGRILTDNWNLYDTRHAVFRPSHMTAEPTGARLLEGEHRVRQLPLDLAIRGDQAARCRPRAALPVLHRPATATAAHGRGSSATARCGGWSR